MIPPYTGLVPSRDDPANFSAAGDAFLSWLINTFVPAANILEQSLQWVGTTGTSDSLVAVGTGAKTWATQPDKAWAVGVWVYAVSASSMGNIMQGQVTAYDVETGALSVDVVGAAGAGSHADWIIGLAPAIAVAGSIGVTDADGRFAGLNIEAVLTEVARLEGDMIEVAGDASEALQVVPLQQVQALIAEAVAAAVPPGSISAQARLAGSPGWLLVDGKTVGNAASGATSRANADTWLLFEQVWAFPAASVPIFDSAGVASVRGASAAADFAAGKRLALFTPDGGAFMRMWAPGQTTDAGRAAGSVQGAYAGSFTVSTGADDGDSGFGSFRSVTDMWFNGVQLIGGGAGSGTVIITPGDTRGYNLSIPHYIKL